MRNYEEFKKAAMERMQEAFAEYEVIERKINKNNQTLDGITLMDGGKVAPVVYADRMYKEYIYLMEEVGISEEEAFFRVTSEIIIILKRNLENEAPKMAKSIDIKEALDNTVLVLINTAQNEELLKAIPHRKFFDLSIIYKWVVEDREDGSCATATITNSLLEQIGVSEEELYMKAVENTARMRPLRMDFSLNIMRERLERGLAEAEDPREQFTFKMALVELDEQLSRSECLQVCITNDIGVGGAIYMCDKAILRKAADMLESDDIYILPSSTEDVLCLSTKEGMSVPDYEQHLVNMVREVNDTQVELENRLSYSVYYYNKVTDEFRVITK